MRICIVKFVESQLSWTKSLQPLSSETLFDTHCDHFSIQLCLFSSTRRLCATNPRSLLSVHSFPYVFFFFFPLFSSGNFYIPGINTRGSPLIWRWIRKSFTWNTLYRRKTLAGTQAKNDVCSRYGSRFRRAINGKSYYYWTQSRIHLNFLS